MMEDPMHRCRGSYQRFYKETGKIKAFNTDCFQGCQRNGVRTHQRVCSVCINAKTKTREMPLVPITPDEMEAFPKVLSHNYSVIHDAFVAQVSINLFPKRRNRYTGPSLGPQDNVRQYVDRHQLTKRTLALICHSSYVHGMLLPAQNGLKIAFRDIMFHEGFPPDWDQPLSPISRDMFISALERLLLVDGVMWSRPPVSTFGYKVTENSPVLVYTGSGSTSYVTAPRHGVAG